MYSSDDGDSRDSGYSDTTTSRPPSVLGSTVFSPVVEDEINDMDEVFGPEEGASGSVIKSVVAHPAVKRVRLADTTNYHASPVSRKNVPFEGRLYKARSTMLFPRKRVFSQEEEEQPETEAKHLRAASTATAASAEHDDTPPSRKFNRRPPRIGIFQRVNSTSCLEVKSHDSSAEPPQIASTTYSLPVVAVKDTTMAFRRIHADTLRGLMTSLSEEEFLSRYILVDCRYPYEYSGGHIQHAVNFFDTTRCADYFFDKPETSTRTPIFYCEYSQKRGPGMATALRSIDRIRNMEHYPRVTFEEIYVLDQGYKGFFSSTGGDVIEKLCEPCDYVRMDDDRFGQELRKYNFHKKNHSGGATCMRAEPQPAVSRPVVHRRRPPTRRGLFAVPQPIVASPEETCALKPKRLAFSPISPPASS